MGKKCNVCGGIFPDEKINTYKRLKMCPACYNEDTSKKRCPSCKVGKLLEIGCRQFCPECHYNCWVVNDEYIQNCILFISSLLSNTAYRDYKSFVYDVRGTIITQLPILNYHLETTQQGSTEVIENICREVRVCAVNLQIESEESGENSDA